MQLVDTPYTQDLNDIYREIKQLELTENVTELEMFGYTVIENAVPLAWVERAQEVILAEVENRLGRRPNLDAEESLSGFGDFDPNIDPSWRKHQHWELVAYLLFKDPVFENFLLNPKPLALVTYLLGKSCLLSSMTCHFKGPGDDSMIGLHSDNGNGIPEPFPAYAQVCNINYVLTEYTEAGGCLGIVPGSHRYGRRPVGQEAVLDSEKGNKGAIPIEVPVGSAVIWHGNTWHGSYNRTIPGIRMNLATYFCRQSYQTQEKFREHIPPAVLERHADTPRFKTLMGLDTYYGWGAEGPQGQHFNRDRAGLNWYA